MRTVWIYMLSPRQDVETIQEKFSALMVASHVTFLSHKAAYTVLNIDSTKLLPAQVLAAATKPEQQLNDYWGTHLQHFSLKLLICASNRMQNTTKDKNISADCWEAYCFK